MNPTSACYWLPLIENAGLPTPSTVVVPYDHKEIIVGMEGDADTPKWAATMIDLEAAAVKIGWPAFLRTDMASAKHDGPESYLLAGVDDIVRAASFTVQDCELKFWLEPGATPTAFLVREFLTLDAPFTAFGWGGRPGHPVAREWRYFASRDGVLCRHFYWPEHAIAESHPSVENWVEVLAGMAAERPPDILDQLAIEAAAACEDAAAWSVDFARDATGAWYLIDMAEAHKSWHPDHEPGT